MLDILSCDQNSEEWLAARCGIPTASEFSSVLARPNPSTKAAIRHAAACPKCGAKKGLYCVKVVKGEEVPLSNESNHAERREAASNGFTPKEMSQRKQYLYKLAGEVITGKPSDSYGNAHMERGHEMEPDARALYEFTFDVEVEQVGFIRNGRKGCSPDGLVGTDGMSEIKTKLPHIMVETILRGTIPPEHKAQTQGQLWVAEREWVDFSAYWPGFPLFNVRSYRDEPYIKAMSDAVDAFNDELDAIVEKVRAYGERA